VSRDDRALALSGRIAAERPRLGALDVDDPRVQEAALRAKVQIVDISKLEASDRLNHDRYANLAALYPRLATNPGLHRSGVFVLDAVGATITSPLQIVGNAPPRNYVCRQTSLSASSRTVAQQRWSQNQAPSPRSTIC
jgi:hypothetical protein